MEKIYFTITGTNYRFGQGFFEPGQRVTLRKDPDNEYDKEAIKVEMAGLGQVGWVANSVRTRLGE
ncbi:MAG: HIRAN domain-containing protein, partial [Firmicutes bacterium]|nr:HIRAN domain-containing protein [Bacillota bacterium]